MSFHYGPAGSGRKVYIQASLHADELPGMLVAHHLRQKLLALEAQGALLGEVVVVPVANPIGLAQTLLRAPHGRFDLATRRELQPPLRGAAGSRCCRCVDGVLGDDEAANTRAPSAVRCAKP